MKIQTSRVVVAFAFGLSAVVGMCRGAALHGTDYVEGGVGMFQFGDEAVDDVFGEFALIRGEINLNVAKKSDIGVKVEALHGSGESEGRDLTMDGFDASVQFNLLFLPGEKVDPYVFVGLGVQHNSFEGEADGHKETDDDTGFGGQAGGGVEFDLSEKLLLDVSLTYKKRDDFDSIAGGVKLGVAFTERLLGIARLTYAFDEEDVSATVGVAFKL